MPKEKVNVCVALNLISKAIEKEKSIIPIYKELYNIENPEFGFGNTFLYFKADAEKHLGKLEGFNRRLTDIKKQKEIWCAGD